MIRIKSGDRITLAGYVKDRYKTRDNRMEETFTIDDYENFSIINETAGKCSYDISPDKIKKVIERQKLDKALMPRISEGMNVYLEFSAR